MTTPASTFVTRTDRLELHRTREQTDIDALLEIFNSNPRWIASTNDFTVSVARSTVRAFLESLGYTAVEERLDQDKRRYVVMEKVLSDERSRM